MPLEELARVVQSGVLRGQARLWALAYPEKGVARLLAWPVFANWFCLLRLALPRRVSRMLPVCCCRRENACARVSWISSQGFSELPPLMSSNCCSSWRCPVGSLRRWVVGWRMIWLLLRSRAVCCLRRRGGWLPMPSLLMGRSRQVWRSMSWRRLGMVCALRSAVPRWGR